MRSERIAELLRPFLEASESHAHRRSESSRALGEETVFLSSAQLSYISTYIDLLQHWNARINLTAVRDEEEIVTRHFGESLFAARWLFPDPTRVAKTTKSTGSAVRLADIGSGAGFPGIPMKLWAPQLSLTLVESNLKKATFLREVVRSLTLTNIDIQNVRAETITATFDVVTLRAVDRMVEVLPIAERLLVRGARMTLLVSSSLLDQVRSALPGFTWRLPVAVPGSSSRLLLVGKRQEST